MFPQPPAELMELRPYPKFLPAHDLRDWALETFVMDGAPHLNATYQHLQVASILFVWSSVCFRRHGKTVVGTTQAGQQQGSLGKKEFLESFYMEWNGGTRPDFIITLCAPYLVEAEPTAIMALIEHELHHCGQAVDEWGQPRFRKNSMPIFALRGHDVEEFVGVVQRYGTNGDENLEAMKEALNSTPSISAARANVVCGCGARV